MPRSTTSEVMMLAGRTAPDNPRAARDRRHLLEASAGRPRVSPTQRLRAIVASLAGSWSPQAPTTACCPA
jgi:hypothetical protein